MVDLEQVRERYEAAPDALARWGVARVAQAHAAASQVLLADLAARALADMWEGEGLSLAEIGRAVGIGSRSRVHRLVRRGLAVTRKTPDKEGI